ncbi:hypothetical protein Snoj_78050 [Streptomyces nojiriensis]|uniref:Uncharacterized protein n=1 Tax=Streptomyces nojiriensis TaxID=66374 RepID=A0ABQ3T0G2_9ACTN|nr:hypothetical protein GCM10010205_04260 [Streptomyces nojiriensis]GHI73887.1 hypothetical protein Snoj_78050 [Streptomyces nojiriensis]
MVTLPIRRTGQVRFYPVGAPQNEAGAYGGDHAVRARDGRDPVEPLPLTEIPALVLSEVLRDVDLFVGVAGVGNDPAGSAAELLGNVEGPAPGRTGDGAETDGRSPAQRLAAGEARQGRAVREARREG